MQNLALVLSVGVSKALSVQEGGSSGKPKLLELVKGLPLADGLKEQPQWQAAYQVLVSLSLQSSLLV